MGAMSALKTLDLQSNRLTGALPSTMGGWFNLASLTVQNNRLTGALPISIGNCTKLKVLNAFENEFSGAIPDTIGHMSMLQQWDMHNNAKWHTAIQYQHAGTFDQALSLQQQSHGATAL